MLNLFVYGILFNIRCITVTLVIIIVNSTTIFQCIQGPIAEDKVKIKRKEKKFVCWWKELFEK